MFCPHCGKEEVTQQGSAFFEKGEYNNGAYEEEGYLDEYVCETCGNSILKLAADSPDRLRRSDVYRVLEEAKSAGCLKGFVRWLKKQPVPFTVANEIDKTLSELVV